MPRNGSTAGGLEVSSPDLKRLAAELKNADKKLATAMRRELRAVGEPMRRAVAAEASWSRRIPGATRVGIKATKTSSAVIVQVDRRKAPHARPLEHGSKGNRGFIRHPLFGNRDVFVQSPTRPFFAPAIERQGGRIDSAVRDIAEKYERMLGFK